jgi:hypothetical protein
MKPGKSVKGIIKRFILLTNTRTDEVTHTGSLSPLRCYVMEKSEIYPRIRGHDNYSKNNQYYKKKGNKIFKN